MSFSVWCWGFIKIWQGKCGLKALDLVLSWKFAIIYHIGKCRNSKSFDDINQAH